MSAVMNAERRRFGRREVDGIDGSLYATSDAKIVDISVDGLSIETTRSLRAGVRFEWEQKESVTDLCRFLEENALITLDREIYGRFTVHSPTLARVEFLAGFAVKRIGLSGMLAEVDFAPEVGSGLDIQLLVGEKTLEAKGSIAGVKRIEWKASIPLALVEVKLLELSVEA
jgi:hypothetical protein